MSYPDVWVFSHVNKDINKDSIHIKLKKQYIIEISEVVKMGRVLNAFSLSPIS